MQRWILLFAQALVAAYLIVGWEIPTAEAGKSPGCLRCHAGIEIINERMQPFLLAFAGQRYGKGEGYECAICHEGHPDAAEKTAAHADLIPNPSSMWVLHQGKGCAQCHDGKGTLTTLLGKPLDKPVGGSLLSLHVSSEDPTGATGFDYTYRVARSLMGLETGKANKILSSNGIIPKGSFPYADFDMDDPDGAVPRVGSKLYQAWVNKALEAGFIHRLDRVQEIPEYHRGVGIFGSGEKAGFADIHRKQCGRCHVWGEGRGKRGDLRASGCAACHMIYGNDGKYEGRDPTIAANTSRPHPLKHRITTAIPAAQCTHCHTRGKRIGTTFVGAFEYDYVKDHEAPPFDPHGNPQQPLFTKEYLRVREDVHFQRGMQCDDCHTSIDNHGDGNIYPVTYYQVEVSCYDCHGTPDHYPWELPVGYGTPVVLPGARGTHQANGQEYLLTSKGNVKANWLREGDSVLVVSRYTGKKHQVPLLKTLKLEDRFRTLQGKVAMVTVHQHIDKLECYACHATWAPQCFGCHMKYDRRVEGTDWITTSKRVDPVTGRQTLTRSKGNLAIENRSFMRSESPILGVDYKGKVSPLVPGCQVFYTFVDEKGELKTLNKFYTTSTGHNSPTLAPLQPHSISTVARTCEDCHTNPKAIGYGTGNSRSAAVIQGDEPMYQDLSKGIYGDVPGAETGRWQVPKIADFPYTLDQLVTRSGKQIQNMPLPEDRPLNREERDRVEREGLCLGCHRHYGTEAWQTLVKRFGKARTAKEHQQMMSRALQSLMKSTH